MIVRGYRERPPPTPRSTNIFVSYKVDLDGRRSHLPAIDGKWLALADVSVILGWFRILHVPSRFFFVVRGGGGVG